MVRNPALFRARDKSSVEFDPDVNIVLKLGFALLLVDIFLTMSRALEILSLAFNIALPYVGVSIHLMTFLAAFVSGGVRRVASSRTGIFVLLFTSWMMICTPVSAWRTGSLMTILNQWLPALTAFLACGAIVTLRQCHRITSAVGAGGVVIAIASFFLGKIKFLRFEFDAGTLGNANELTLLLLLTAPFLLVPLYHKGAGRLTKLLSLCACAVVLAVSFRAGSRGGLLALVAILFALFLTSSAMGKLKLGLAIVSLSLVCVATLPTYVLSRYMTIFTDAENMDDPNLKAEAYGSTHQRKELLRESLLTTLKHPLFGVGPGVFAAAQAREATEAGVWRPWAVSHNAYTQVSSEMGLVGLLLYIGAIVSTFRDVLWMRRNSKYEPSGYAYSLSLALLLSLVGVVTNFFFSSNAYVAWLPILMALGITFRASLERSLEHRAAAPQQAGSKPAARAMAPPAPAPAFAAAHYRFLRPRRTRG
jgi:O-antigen ligase